MLWLLLQRTRNRKEKPADNEFTLATQVLNNPRLCPLDEPRLVKERKKKNSDI